MSQTVVGLCNPRKHFPHCGPRQTSVERTACSPSAPGGPGWCSLARHLQATEQSILKAQLTPGRVSSETSSTVTGMVSHVPGSVRAQGPGHSRINCLLGISSSLTELNFGSIRV